MSDMNDERKFCTSCGAMLPAGAEFCPECGAGVGGNARSYAGRTYANTSGRIPGVNIAKPLLLIYGVLAIIMAVTFLYNGYILDEALYNEIVDMYLDMGVQMPPWDDFNKTQMMVAGAFMLTSAVIALMSYWFCKNRGPKRNAVVSCAVASLLVLGVMDVTAVIMLVIGFIVTYMIYKDDASFDS